MSRGWHGQNRILTVLAAATWEDRGVRTRTVMSTVAGVLVALGGCTTDDGGAASTTAAPTTAAPTTVAPTTPEPTTLPSTTSPSTTVPPPTPAPSTAPPTTSATTTAPPTVAPTTAPAGQLPPCDGVDLSFGDDGEQRFVDCLVAAPDDSVPAFAARYGAGPSAEEDGTLTLVATDGSQTITERYNIVFATPYYDDLDGNGTHELLVPLFSGASNTVYAIWLDPGGGAPLVRGQEVPAVSFGRSENGEVVAIGHVSAAESVYTFSRIAGGVMTAIAGAFVDVAAGTCRVEDFGGLAALGLTDDGARERFCGDPVVTG
jgi:hypothetical protein